MRNGGLNRVQRIVIIIGLGVGLYVFGGWITTRGNAGAGYGWVAYAPLSTTASPQPIGGLHPWVRLLIWLALILLWMIASLWLLRSPSDAGEGGPTAQ
jgi:hypothetical protein